MDAVEFGTLAATKGEARGDVQDEAEARFGWLGAEEALAAYDDEMAWRNRPMTPPEVA